MIGRGTVNRDGVHERSLNHPNRLPWRCATPGCALGSVNPGLCLMHLVELRPTEIVAAWAADLSGPDGQPVHTGTGRPYTLVALDFPWGELIEVPAEGLKIGRGSTALGEQVRDYEQISWWHARLWWSGAELLIDDCDSATRTYVDGEAITAGRPVPLRPGQRLRLGPDIHVDVVQLHEDGRLRTPGRPQ